MSYNKLVRDKVPSIIRESGEIPKTRILDDNEYKEELEKKLYEEYQEVLDSNCTGRIEELADMVEVIGALATLEGESLDKVIEVAKSKKKERGGFEDKVFLISVEEEN